MSNSLKLYKMRVDTLVIIIIFTIYCCNSTELPYTSPDGCSVAFDSIGTSFNLCPMQISSRNGQIKYYKVKDSRSIENENNTILEYYFNIGAPLEIIPPFCVNYTFNNMYCQDKNCTQTIEINGAAWAYQIVSDPKTNIPFFCTPLSNTNGGPPKWSLIHPDDPTEGVQLTYINGGRCGDSNKNRQLNLQFYCENNIRSVNEEIALYEYEICEYTLQIKSIYGCPISCKEYDYNLCANNGLCGYDFTNKQPRCFCFDKYTSDDCSQYNMNQTIGYNATKTHPNPNSQFVHTFHETNVNVTYDLNAFELNGASSAYIVHDKDKSKDFVYYTGVPDPLLPPSMGGQILPDFCENITAPCRNINSTGACLDDPIERYTNYGFVFQVNFVKEECFVLGTNVRWELYDEKNDAARGVSIIYYDGSFCEGTGQNRQFVTNLICPKDQDITYSSTTESQINEYEYVEESDEHLCSYSFTKESAIACPYQCITDSTLHNDVLFSVCSTQGICAADPNAGMVRCLCDHGWKGIDCDVRDTPNPSLYPTQIPSQRPTVRPTDVPTTAPSDNNSGSKTSLIVVVVILVLVILGLIIIGYFGVRYAKLKIQKAQQSGDFTKIDDDGLINADVVQHAVVKDEKGKSSFETIEE